MTKYINKIEGTLINTEKKISIDLQGKNLIITGANGCGKTRLLNQLFDHLIQFIDLKNSLEGASIQQNINSYQQQLNRPNLPSSQKSFLDKAINDLKAKIAPTNCTIIFSDDNALRQNSQSNNLVLRLFKATRQYQANKIDHSATVTTLRNQAKLTSLRDDTSINFESYLVTYLNAGYMAYALRQDEAEKNKVDAWLAAITKDLRFLFEDDSLTLEYREKEKRFYIKQQGKDPFTFEQLSSGYSAILTIYTDLLMKVELREITAEALSGIVLIDEIDAHLHVSLQKKILAFLTNAYPNIQFIVSTHSSLVIQSVNDAVIYDLSKLEQLENLSMYSADAITKGLLGVNATSNDLNSLIAELARLTPDIEQNQIRVKELIDILRPSESGLDSRAKVALLMAKQALLDHDLPASS